MIEGLLFGLFGNLFTTIRGRSLLISILIGGAVAAIAGFALAAADVHEDVVILVPMVVFVVAVVAALILLKKLKLAKLAVTDEQHRQLLIGGFIATSNNERNDIFKLYKTSRSTAKSMLDSWWDINNPNAARQTAMELASAQVHTEFADDVYHNIAKKGIVTPTPNDFVGLKPETAEQDKRIRKGVTCYNKALKMLKKAGITEEDIAGITTLAAWDYGRAAFIARYSAAAKFMTEEEAWPHIQQAAENANAAYDNWKQYVAAYVIGRAIAYGDVLYIGRGRFSEKSDFARVSFKP